MKMKNIVLFISLIVLLGSCSEHQKLLKTTDLNLKYEKAIEYYENGDYIKALPLFEELIIIYRGTPKAEKLSYYQSYCDYRLGNLLLAGFRFKNFAKTYPLSSWAEESLFMSAYCNYLNSPGPSLDQTATYAALEDLKLFTKIYPESQLIDSCNVLIDGLRSKLETKNYNTAYQYYHMKRYQSAIVAFNNLIKDFPGTHYHEISSFYILKSSYLLAVNSILSKKEERIEDTIKSYVKFVDSFPKSSKIKEAESIYEGALKEKEIIKKNKDGL